MVSSKTWILVAVAVAIIGVSLSGCGGGSGTPIVTGKVGSVSGRILDLMTTLPLGGVRVTIGSKFADTDAQGYFTVTDIPKGLQSIAITPDPATNWVLPPGSQNPTVTVVADDTVVLDTTIFLMDSSDVPPVPPT